MFSMIFQGTGECTSLQPSFFNVDPGYARFSNVPHAGGFHSLYIYPLFMHSAVRAISPFCVVTIFISLSCPLISPNHEISSSAATELTASVPHLFG